MLLIITNKDDFSSDFLICELLKCKKPYFRLNSEEIAGAGYEFSNTNGELSRSMVVYGKKIDLTKVTAVHYRRSISPIPPPGIDCHQYAFVRGELQHLVEGLIFDQSIKWVNPISSVNIAERKLYQLRIAEEIGLLVPPTLVSNDSKAMKLFIVQHIDVICKPIYQGLLVTNKEKYAVYTHRIALEDLDSDEQLKLCPTLLQKEIHKLSDIRLTIIGEDVYPVEIYSDTKQPLDWRSPEHKVKYRNCNIEPAIIKLCKVMLKRLNLLYGAFDFAKSLEGDLYFLEVNPTGEWAWQEKTLGLPMRQSFIKLFYEK